MGVQFRLLNWTAIVFFAILALYQPHTFALSDYQQSQLQQTLYTNLSALHTISEHERLQVINQLAQLSFDRFLLGFAQPSYLVKLLTAQTLEHILKNYNLSEQHSYTNNHHQSTSSHHFNVELAALSDYFIEYYTKHPVSYNLLPSDPNTPQDYYKHEKHLVNNILHPIITVAISDIHPDLRHTAISALSLIVEEFPGTSLLMIKLLQYYSGEDVYIGTKLFQGSHESDAHAGAPSKANQRFLAKITRLHLSNILYDDFEMLRLASQTVLELYKDAQAEGHRLDGTSQDQEEVDLKRQNERYHTLSRNLHTNGHLSPSTLKKKASIYTQLNIKDITIDNVINQVHVFTAQSEDYSVLAECSFALSRSKLSPDHLNTLYSLVISPYYDVSKHAIDGIKRIGLISAIPGTITHTVDEEVHELAELPKDEFKTEYYSKSKQAKARAKDEEAKTKIQLSSSTELVVDERGSQPPTISKQYVSAVSQAELSTMLQPQQGQLAIKILSHASRKHPHHHLQELSGEAFNDVILEVKSQLQSWFVMIKSKGLEMYNESDHSRSTLQDVKYNLQFMAAGKKDRKRIAMEHELYKKTQQLYDDNGNAITSIQQLIYLSKSPKTVSSDRDSTKKFDNGSVLIARQNTPTGASLTSTKPSDPQPSSSTTKNKKDKPKGSGKRKAAAKKLAAEELQRFLNNSDGHIDHAADQSQQQQHHHQQQYAPIATANSQPNSIHNAIPTIPGQTHPGSTPQQQSA